jgi:hypothetical protein
MLDSPKTSAPMLMRGPQRAFHPTDHVQQDIHPTDNPPPSARKIGARKTRRRVRLRRGRLPNSNPPKSAYAGDAVHRTNNWGTVPMGQCNGCHRGQAQCTFLPITYSVENPHADGSAAPGARPRFCPPRRRDPHDTSPAPTTTGWREDRCPVVSKQPLHSRAAAKMSPHIRIGPEPVLTAHAPSLPAAGSHCPAREDSAPHCGAEFQSREEMANLRCPREICEDVNGRDCGHSVDTSLLHQEALAWVVDFDFAKALQAKARSSQSGSLRQVHETPAWSWRAYRDNVGEGPVAADATYNGNPLVYVRTGARAGD